MISSDKGAPVLVVGASLAGMRAAIALRRRGHEGPITLLGAERHWPPFDRPPLSKQVLTGAMPLDQARLRLPDGLDLDVLTSCRVASLDVARSCVRLDDGSERPFERLLIATGASPRRLPDTDLPWVHSLRSADDAERLSSQLASARSIAVVGAGFIGSEVASACRGLGVEVTVVDVADHVLTPLGPVVADSLAARMRHAGVELRLGTSVLGIEEHDRARVIRLGDGSTIAVDLVVVGIGVQPATQWLDGSTLQIDDGVLCNAACLALGGEGRIAAAGDVARWDHPAYGSIRIEHWTNAGEQAAHAARALLEGADAGPFSPVPYVWSDQFGLKLQYVGHARPEDDVVVEEGALGDERFVVSYRRDGRVTAALCVNEPRSVGVWTMKVAGDQGALRRLSPR